MEPSEPISIDDILDGFRDFDGTYQRERVDAALARREEIIPRLIGVLEEIIADPEGFQAHEDRLDHIYALMLLGHFKAVSAHAAIVQVFSLEPKLVDELFGDHIHEDLPVVLMRTCGGDLRHIRLLASDRSVNIYCRIAAVRAMTFAVAATIARRDEVMTFIASFFAGDDDEPEPEFLSFLAISLMDLYPAEHMALIEKAYEEGRIHSDIVDLEDYKQAFAQGQEQILAQLHTQLEKADLGDIHAAMSWWACFDEAQEWTAATGPSDLIGSGLFGRPRQPVPARNEKARKIDRRKPAKASKPRKRR